MLGTYISGGLGLLGAAQSLFGKSNSAYKDDRANANNNAGSLADIRNWYSTQKTDQNNFYKSDNADARAGLGRLGDFLTTDPNNDSAYARDLARADNGLHANIAKMTLQNAATGAANGVPGAAPSSSTSGVNAYLQALDALGTSANQVGVADTNRQLREKNLTDYYNLYNNQAGQDYGNANTAATNETNISGQLMNYWNGQAQDELQQDQAQGGATLSGLGGVASTVASMFPGGGGGTAVQKMQHTLADNGINGGGRSYTGGPINYTNQPIRLGIGMQNGRGY